ncbi:MULTISPECIES: beta/gamma crystallin domain-containing protein [Streptomyces]|uniref:Streptomyces killer toxin-like beta/gamma crystallin domain-containing protein n=1 Tax=Streptomyces sanyensis TaxID=568869 RepID=A0ABP8ZS72_9ACTN
MTNRPISHVLRLAGVTTAALLTTVTAALPAHAVNRTECGNRTDFFKIESVHGSLCFANAGEMNVAVYGVNWISTGNNKVRFRFQAVEGDPRRYEISADKWVAYNPVVDSYGVAEPGNRVHKIEWIKIY